MSGAWGWFGGAAAQKSKSNTKDAILSLRSQLEMLQKRERHLQNQADEQDALARKMISTNKAAAKQALTRKKAHEHTLDQTQGQIVQLEKQIGAIESANINKGTLEAMQKASAAMKQIHGKLNPDLVDKTMDELNEQNELSNEIVTAITGAQIGEPVDQDELDAELEALQQEQLDADLLKTGNVPVSDQIHRMPAAANGEIKGKAVAAAEYDEEEELRKLQAEMAM